MLETKTTFHVGKAVPRGLIGLGEILFLGKAYKLTKPEQLDVTFAI